MTLKVSIAQINPIIGSFKHNRQLALDAIAQVKSENADVVVFPELALTGYPPEDLLLRPAFLEKVASELQFIAKKAKGISVIMGAPLVRDNKLFNMACVLRDGKIRAEYAKQHLPNYRVFDEKRYFRRGIHFKQQTQIIEIDSAGNKYKVALLICEDIWMETPIELAKQAGAEVVFVLNASPFRMQKSKERLALLKLRSSANNLPIVYANMVGAQDELVFDGGSLVFDQTGNLAFQAPAFQAGVYSVDVPLRKTINSIQAKISSKEERIYNALVLGVKDYVRKNGFPGIILGLSGGIDSALTMAIAVDALGAENVEAVMMPFHYTADMSKEDASQQAKIQGVKYREIPIEPMFNTFMDALEKEFEGLERDTTEENIQARSRGVLLMALSNKLGKMLLATGNKSEMAVGYATLYGDMAGGFAPLKDVFKTMVYKLARYRNSIGYAFDGGKKGYVEIIPERVITRPPSAELAPDQVDEDSLPPYDVLDAILRMFIEEFQSVDEIVAQGYDMETVERVAKMVLLNEYKRRQAPPGVRISKRAFGKDRRYPITSHYRWHLLSSKQE